MRVTRFHDLHRVRVFGMGLRSSRTGKIKALSIALVLFSLQVTPSTAQQKRVGGTLRGRVEDQVTTKPIPGTLLEFMDGRTRIRASTTSDAEGNFALANLPDGSFRLRVTRIGYTDTTTPYWRIQSGEILSIVVRLDVKAVPLAPLEVSARARTASPVLEGFYSRMERRLGGTFISRADIERRNPSLITDLLADLPGIYLESAPGLGRNARVVTFGPRIGPGGGKCPVQVFVDGVLATRRTEAGTSSPVSVDELATPGSLEGLELYRGLSTMPPELITPDARCGVIALWTRRG